MSQIAGEVWPVILAAVLLEAPGDIDTGEALGTGQLNVRIGFVVAQQDVEAGLLEFNEVVFECQRLFFIVHNDVFDIHGLTQQGASLGIGLAYTFIEVGAYPGPQALGLAHIDDLAFGVLVHVHAGLGGKGSDFLDQVHG